MKLSERDGKAIIDKYINDELKYKNYLKLKEAYENDPSKNPMPKAVVQPPVEPKPFIFTNALRERKSQELTILKLIRLSMIYPVFQTRSVLTTGEPSLKLMLTQTML
jgi:hypothetical protein